MANEQRGASSLLARLGREQQPPPWDFLAVTNSISILFIMTVLVGLLVAGAWLEGATFVVIGLAGRSIGAVATLLYIAGTRREPDDRAALAISESPLPLPFMLLIGIGAAITIDVIGLLLVGGEAFINSEPAMIGFFSPDQTSGALGWGLAVVYLVLLRPIVEGVVFFGIVLPWARARAGAWAGLLICISFFALYHFGTFMFLAASPPTLDFPLVWYSVFAPLLIGLFLAAVRVLFSSTRAAIAAYVAFGIFTLLKLALIGG